MGRYGPGPKPIDVTCCECGTVTEGRYYSKAAPMMDALIGLRAIGWTYDAGIASMLSGNYRPVCPDCTARIRAEAQKPHKKAPPPPVKRKLSGR